MNFFEIALRRSSHACAAAAGPVVRRDFSSSTVLLKYGAVPKFTEVSNPELQDVLQTLRTNVIMPNHLGSNQRDLIFKKKLRSKLEAEPVIVNIQGEEFQLKHLDIHKDLVPRRKTLMRALKLMQGRDWDNLPNLLTGLHNSGYDLYAGKDRGNDIMEIARKAGKAGRMDVVLESLRRVQKTGMSLKSTKVVRAILFELHRKAHERDQSLEDSAKTLSWAKQIVTMLDDPSHVGGLSPKHPGDPRSSPHVVGFLLELAALKSVRYGDSKDDAREVLEYATKLLATSLPLKAEGLSHGEPASVTTEVSKNIRPVETRLSESLRYNVSVLYGMALALKVLDPASKVAENLRKQIDITKPLLLSQVEDLTRLCTDRGVEVSGTVSMATDLLASEEMGQSSNNNL